MPNQYETSEKCKNRATKIKYEWKEGIKIRIYAIPISL